MGSQELSSQRERHKSEVASLAARLSVLSQSLDAAAKETTEANALLREKTAEAEVQFMQ